MSYRTFVRITIMTRCESRGQMGSPGKDRKTNSSCLDRRRAKLLHNVMAMRLASLLVLLALVSIPIGAGCQTRTVALTFDDLPFADAGKAGMTPDERIVTAQAVNRSILTALHRHHAPAIAFVNENKVTAYGAAEPPRFDGVEIRDDALNAGVQ